MLAHPQGGELSQRPHLRKSDRLERMAEAEPAATLHLTEDQGEPCISDIGSDNVDLPGYVSLDINICKHLYTEVT
jgi:hypothetical protein